MRICRETSDLSRRPPETLARFFAVFIFSIAFGYIEAAVVVYLREIFYPAGFNFPLTGFGCGPVWEQLLWTEVGREATTLVVIFTVAWLFGKSRQQRFAYFFVVFAVWDIFYYIWLKVLIGWPASLMDWDILFLIPAVWASPVLAPVLVSATMLLCAVEILYRDFHNKPLKASLMDKVGFFLAAFAAVFTFCFAGLHIAEPDYKTYFYWPVFALANVSVVALFLKCLLRADPLAVLSPRRSRDATKSYDN